MGHHHRRHTRGYSGSRRRTDVARILNVVHHKDCWIVREPNGLLEGYRFERPSMGNDPLRRPGDRHVSHIVDDLHRDR